MSDVEHELVIENDALRAELARVAAIAERALTVAKEAQDAAVGRHDAWLDDALENIDHALVHVRVVREEER